MASVSTLPGAVAMLLVFLLPSHGHLCRVGSGFDSDSSGEWQQLFFGLGACETGPDIGEVFAAYAQQQRLGPKIEANANSIVKTARSISELFPPIGTMSTASS
jgi:hypothetical protein